MVVFSTEYWAPGMNNNTANNNSSSTVVGKQHHQSQTNKDSTLPPPQKRNNSNSANSNKLLNPVIPNSIFSSPAVESLSDFGAESIKESLIYKKKDLPTKLKASGSNLNSAKGSNIQEHNNNSGEILHGVKSVWLDMLSNKVGKKQSVPSSRDNNNNQPLSLEQKYGVCEKGCIGRGASAVVRIAYKVVNNQISHKQDKIYYAIKEFRKRRKNETEREYVKKLTGEFCISSTLHHKNIVETIDLIQDEHKNWCEVMEYCPGGDLYNVIRNGAMSLKEINCCFKQIIFGVEYLHNMGVAHRDIKPENILINENGLIKITDFGVSDVFRMVWESENHKSRGLCGSEPYIAPEQFTDKEYDARAVDIWACAIVYYAMVNTSILFKHAVKSDSTFLKFVENYDKRTFSGFKSLPNESVNLMYKMLSVDPIKRAKVDEIIIDKWFASIETCEDCMSSKGFHNHFSTDYVPKKSKTLLPPSQ